MGIESGAGCHVMDNDWGFVGVEPWGKDGVERLLKAAAVGLRGGA